MAAVDAVMTENAVCGENCLQQNHRTTSDMLTLETTQVLTLTNIHIMAVYV
jgi:hypothetical protein